MSTPHPALVKALGMSLEGTEAHVKTLNAMAGLSAENAGKRPAGAPHTVFQLLNHLLYWQDRCLEWLEGGDPAWPEHAPEGWPGGARPESGAEWASLVARFRGGVERVMEHTGRDDLLTVRGRWAPVQVLRTVASHNSYHLGQIVLLRRMLGAWPPPGGGDTW